MTALSLDRRDLEEAVQAAIEGTLERLRGMQAPAGWWRGTLEGDAGYTAWFILTACYLGRRDGERFADMERYLRATQAEHEGWTAWPGGPPELNITECGMKNNFMGLFAGLLIGGVLFLACGRAEAGVEWVRGELMGARGVWGVRGGLIFGIHPGEGSGARLPRGLIRLAYPTLKEGGYDLINFIAIEPVVSGRRGLSELESSTVDGKAGKRISAMPSAEWKMRSEENKNGESEPEGGRVTKLDGGAELLEVMLEVERFENGAHVRVVARQRGDRPDEVEFTIQAEPDSAPLEACVLTATMGNKARTRRLWLKDGAVNCQTLYPNFKGTDFAPHAVFAGGRMLETAEGDALAAVTTDEENPAAVFPFPGTRLWHYGGAKVTQYWRKPKGDRRVDGGLQVAVNARATYWMTARAIPGGAAFENFELRERFHEGQVFTFGITRKTPGELGFPGKE